MSFGKLALLFGATFVGVTLGHSIVRGLMGTGSSPQPVQYSQQPEAPPPCQMEAQQLGQCINLADKDISKCQIYMDMLSECQRKFN